MQLLLQIAISPNVALCVETKSSHICRIILLDKSFQWLSLSFA